MSRKGPHARVPFLSLNNLTSMEDRLTPEDVEEFRRLVREETGYDMPYQEALNRAIELIALVTMLVKPYPEDQPEAKDTDKPIPPESPAPKTPPPSTGSAQLTLPL